MKVECLVIVCIILAIVFIFLRAKRSRYALAILPLIWVPLAYLIGSPISSKLALLIGWRSDEVWIAIVAAALVVAGVSFGILSGQMETKKLKSAYLSSCGLFTLILTWVLIFNIIQT